MTLPPQPNMTMGGPPTQGTDPQIGQQPPEQMGQQQEQ
jgi:hypothetical protein